MVSPMIVHGGLIAIRIGGAWSGALILGPSGAGKSDLALRALAQGFRLVSDDRTRLWTDAGRLFGEAPEPLAGLIEVRGVGVLREPQLRFSEVRLAVRPGTPERLPDPDPERLLGVAVPCLTLDPFEVSAPAKLGRALTAFDAAHKRFI